MLHEAHIGRHTLEAMMNLTAVDWAVVAGVSAAIFLFTARGILADIRRYTTRM